MCLKIMLNSLSFWTTALVQVISGNIRYQTNRSKDCWIWYRTKDYSDVWYIYNYVKLSNKWDVVEWDIWQVSGLLIKKKKIYMISGWAGGLYPPSLLVFLKYHKHGKNCKFTTLQRFNTHANLVLLIFCSPQILDKI